VVAPLSDATPFDGHSYATDLSPDERVGLLPTWIVTRNDLNRAEQRNVAQGVRWSRRRRVVLDADGLMTLHRRMFGDVWRWAGAPRQAEKNIGVADWWRIREHLHQLLGDIAAQIAAGRRPPDEIALEFHHRLVAIHVFANGNGRHARLATDLLVERLGRPPFTWGRANLVDPGEARAAYVAALKKADAQDLTPLLAFARS